MRMVICPCLQRPNVPLEVVAKIEKSGILRAPFRFLQLPHNVHFF